MYLKRMELQGFKSFSSKTKIDFEPGISCIVGPNGSGKSNIADALRWVLGEQNARSIRGGKLEDVIFSGTDKRRSLSLAEVSIILDNSDGHLSLPTSEVSVTRRAIRGGGSEYAINDKPCRLKDIHDLFVDTGVSVDGLSIINQGRINELINARPDERRALVEEAAGIIKYRDRKREAVRRLAETERHLETIGAVIGELADRIGPLSEQSAVARQYVALKEAADKLEIGISVRVLTDAEDKIADIDGKLSESRRLLVEEESKRLALAAEVEQLQLSINQMDEAVTAASENYYELQTGREKAEGELALARSARQNTDANIRRLTGELASLERAIAAKKEEIDDLSAHVARTEAEIAEEEDIILNGQGGEEDIRARADVIADKLGALRKELNEATAEETSLAGRITFKQQLADRNRQERAACALKQQELADEEDTSGKIAGELQERKEKLDAEAQEQSGSAAAQEEELRSLNRKLEEAAGREADLRYRASSAKTRVTMLEEMAAEYEGFFPGVKGLMTAKRKGQAPAGIIGVVSELLDVPEKYRVAVESYLGANIQNVVTEDASSAKAAVAYLKKNNLGRATFLPLDILKVRPAADSSAVDALSGVHGLASELVECERKVRPAVDFLLNNVFISADMDAAMAAAKALKYRNSVVTLDGDMVNPGASISGGSRNKKGPDLLGKKSKLTAARKELAAAEAELAEFQQTTDELRARIHQCSERSVASREKLQDISARASEVTQELSRLRFVAEQREKQRAELTSREQTMLADETAIADELAELTTAHEKAAAAVQTKETEAEQLSAELSMLQEKISGQQDQLTERKVSLASSKQKLRGQRISLERLNDDLNNLNWEAEEKDADSKTAAAEAAELDERIAAQEEALLSLTHTLRDAGAKLDEMKHGQASETGRLLELEKQEKEVAKLRETHQNEVHQLELRKERWLADFDNESEKLSERFQLDLAAARETIGDELGSRTAMTNALNQLRREINALGEVNVSAIAEYEEVSQRYDFLTAQREDMREARAKLDTVIAEMDRIMSSRFRDAYGKLSEAFDKSFNRIFDGGHASLYLSEPDDILETGVEIQVSPPGKKVANYNLLSGGEKSLVGIALMFAMLAVRPTPFCVMDEVDAALDEANINRFTAFLQDKAVSSQFIMITHRQSTMECADALWGVTMEEEGVSTVLSVKLDQVS